MIANSSSSTASAHPSLRQEAPDSASAKAMILSHSLRLGDKNLWIAQPVRRVREASVFGAPDQEWGERVCAAVVLLPADEPLSEDELVQHCRARLAPYKAPKEILFVNELPYTRLGKVAREVLGEWRAKSRQC